MSLPENPTKQQMIDWLRSLPPEYQRDVIKEVLEECTRLLAEEDEDEQSMVE